jgi:hypothetical protein
VAPLVLLRDRCLEPELDQAQDLPVDDALGDAAQQVAMRNLVERNLDRLPITKMRQKQQLSCARATPTRVWLCPSWVGCAAVGLSFCSLYSQTAAVR